MLPERIHRLNGPPVVGTSALITCLSIGLLVRQRSGGYGNAMPISRKSTKPVGITNSSGQPEIVLEIDGLTISMAPPSRGVDGASTEGDEGAEPPADQG